MVPSDLCTLGEKSAYKVRQKPVNILIEDTTLTENLKLMD